MQEVEAVARQYCRRVRRKMPLFLKGKRAYLDQLYLSVVETLEERGQADLAVAEACFGAPQQAASEFFSPEIDPLAEKRAWRRTRWLVALASIAVVALIALIGTRLAVRQMIEETREQANGYIVYSEPEYLTEEEFNEIMEELEENP